MPAPNDPRLDWPTEPGTPGREIWYSLVSHSERDMAFWYRYTLLSTKGGHREGRLWAALTDCERPDRSTFVSRRVPPAEVEAGTDPFVLAVGSGQQTDRGAHGRVDGTDPAASGDEVAVSWQFAYDPDDAPAFTPLRSARLMDALARLGSGQHWSANQSVSMEGTVRVGDQRIDFEDAPGHQGHTVSTNPPERVAWLHCNAFPDEDVALEALNVGGTVAICLRRDGTVHQLNRLRDLVGPWGNRTIEIEPGIWAFRGTGDEVSVEVRVEADTDHWQRVAYRAPDDSYRYNAHCSLSDVELSFEADGDERTLRSNQGRAEWVTAEKPIPGDYRPTWADDERKTKQSETQDT